ncbi:hypothetical protein Syun_022802 [Stephania yunnanensis]|uniref:Peptidase S54 rhomboid domain-containing protein n=1 Tax=Stephania yunnanensis TaxID=152371 RepID=A0AAP0F7Q6_9MAGN
MDTDALYPSLVLCEVILFAHLDALFMKRGYHFVALDLPPWPHLQCALLMEVFITLKVFTKVTYPSDQTILMESSIDDDLDPPPWPPPSSLHSTPYLAPMNLEKKTMMSQCSTQGNHTWKLIVGDELDFIERLWEFSHHSLCRPLARNLIYAGSLGILYTLGASGALNAIMLLDIFLFPTATHYINFFIPVPAMLLGSSQISGSAHLGGALVAALAWARIKKGWF